MIEVVFSDSACGALKIAQNYSVGEFDSGVTVGVILSSDDGAVASEEEIEVFRQEFIERERLEWENGTPMGGNPSDVYSFALSLSIGDISEDTPHKKRMQTLDWLYGIYPDIDDGPPLGEQITQEVLKNLHEVSKRITSGESVRIWYSENPDEMCAMYWFMSEICRLKLKEGQILIVKQPDFKQDETGCVQNFSSWGEVPPGQWHSYLAHQQTAPLSFCKYCAEQWQRLKKENSPLRAVINSRLMSVSETLYDDIIIRQIEQESDEFNEAMIIGKILGKYQLGIGDAWIAHRIEEFIANGKLVIVTSSDADLPSYHRILKKG